MSRAWRWLRSHAGRRGAFLAFLTIVDTGYAYALWTAPRAERVYDLLLPWPAWAVIWATVGLICAAGVFARHDRFSYAAAAALKTAWGLLYLEIWISTRAALTWLSAVIWLAFAATVVLISSWPEPVPLIQPPPPGPLP